MRLPLCFLAASFGISESAAAAAQSLWLDTGGQTFVAVEWLKPEFDGDAGSGFATSVTFLSLRYGPNDRLRFEMDIPIAHFTGSDFDFTETAVGNPYLGVMVGRPDSGASAQLGLRIPFMPDGKNAAEMVGLFTDIDRWEAFVTDFIPVTILASYAWRGPTGAVLRVRGGPSVWIPTDGDGEVLFDYAAQAGYEAESFRVIGGFSGTVILTQEDLDFGRRSFNELGVAAGLRLGQARPGIHLRFPLDEDLSDVLDFAVGIHLGVALP